VKRLALLNKRPGLPNCTDIWSSFSHSNHRDAPANIQTSPAFLRSGVNNLQAPPMAAGARSSGRIARFVLLDIMMPEMDGFEPASASNASTAWREIPTLLHTQRRYGIQSWRAFELGAVDYVPQPFKIARLLARVNTPSHSPSSTSPGTSSCSQRAAGFHRQQTQHMSEIISPLR